MYQTTIPIFSSQTREFSVLCVCSGLGDDDDEIITTVLHLENYIILTPKNYTQVMRTSKARGTY